MPDEEGIMYEKAPMAASILITADNGYELYVNGGQVGYDVGAGAEIRSVTGDYEAAVDASKEAAENEELYDANPGGTPSFSASVITALPAFAITAPWPT